MHLYDFCMSLMSFLAVVSTKNVCVIFLYICYTLKVISLDFV